MTINKQALADCQGFTLIELLVVVSLLGILITVGIPSAGDMLADSRMTAFTNDLVADLNLTRSEAVKRNIPVTICSSTDQVNCSGANNWGSGWIIFTDRTGAAGSVDGTDEILFVRQAPGGNVTLNVDRSFTRYMPSGFAS